MDGQKQHWHLSDRQSQSLTPYPHLPFPALTILKVYAQPSSLHCSSERQQGPDSPAELQGPWGMSSKYTLHSYNGAERVLTDGGRLGPVDIGHVAFSYCRWLIHIVLSAPVFPDFRKSWFANI